MNGIDQIKRMSFAKLLLVIFIASGGGLLAFAFLLCYSGDWGGIVPGVLAVSVFCVVFAAHVKAYPGLDYFSPPFVIALGFIWYFMTSIWYFHFFEDSTGCFLYTTPIWFAAVLGYIFYVLGAWPWRKRSLAGAQAEDSSLGVSPLLLFAVFLVPVCFFHLAFRLADPFVRASLSLVGGALMTAPLFAPLARRCFKQLLAYKYFLAVVIVVTLGVIMYSGSERRTALRVIIYGAIAWNYSAKRLSLKFLCLLLAAALILVYALKVEQASRSFYQKNFFELSIPEFVMVNNNMVGRYGLVFGVARSFDSLPGIENFAALLREVPDNYDYRYGLSYFKLAVALIPRSIWDDKPVNTQNLIREMANTGYKSPAQDFSFLGEAYWNFGWLGICVIPFLFGWFSKFLYFLRHDLICGQRAPGFLYLLWVPFVLEHFRGGFHSITLTVVGTLVFAYPACWALGRLGMRGVVNRASEERSVSEAAETKGGTV